MAKPSDLLKKMDRSLSSPTPVETSPDAREGVRAPSREERREGADVERVEVEPVVEKSGAAHPAVLSSAEERALEHPEIGADPDGSAPPAALEPERASDAAGEGRPRAGASRKTSKKESGGQRKKAKKEGRLPRRLPGPLNPSRFSLDLDPAIHRQLKEVAMDVEVDASVIGRVLVELLIERPDLKESVAARVLELKQAYLRELEQSD